MSTVSPLALSEIFKAIDCPELCSVAGYIEGYLVAVIFRCALLCLCVLKMQSPLLPNMVFHHISEHGLNSEDECF